MPFPISVVGVVVGGVVGGVVTGYSTLYDDHSDHSDHSDYSDAVPRKIRETEANIRQTRKEFAGAKSDLNTTLEQVKVALIAEMEANDINTDLIRDWRPNAEDFNFEHFNRDYAYLDSQIREKIKLTVARAFQEEIRIRQLELDNLNALIRKVNETRLTGGGA